MNLRRVLKKLKSVDPRAVQGALSAACKRPKHAQWQCKKASCACQCHRGGR